MSNSPLDLSQNSSRKMKSSKRVEQVNEFQGDLRIKPESDEGYDAIKSNLAAAVVENMKSAMFKLPSFLSQANFASMFPAQMEFGFAQQQITNQAFKFSPTLSELNLNLINYFKNTQTNDKDNLISSLLPSFIPKENMISKIPMQFSSLLVPPSSTGSCSSSSSSCSSSVSSTSPTFHLNDEPKLDNVEEIAPVKLNSRKSKKFRESGDEDIKPAKKLKLKSLKAENTDSTESLSSSMPGFIGSSIMQPDLIIHGGFGVKNPEYEALNNDSNLFSGKLKSLIKLKCL